MTAIEPALLRAFLKRWRAAARLNLSGSHAGEFYSRFRGRGLEFEELRAYQPGDDVRDIAWTATARLGEPFVKVNRETRGRTVWLLGEDSPRLDFGFGGIVEASDPWAGRAKRRAWLEALTFLSQAALYSGDRVGLAVVRDRPRLESPRRNPLRLAAALAKFSDPASAAVDPWRVLERTKRRGLVVAVADFLAPSFLDRLARIARRHELVAVQIVDPWERELPDPGLVRWRDATTGRVVLVDTTHRHYREQFAAEAGRREEALRRRLAALRAPRVVVRTDAPVFASLAAGWPRR